MNRIPRLRAMFQAIILLACALGATSVAGCTRGETTAGAPRYGIPSITDPPDSRFLFVETPIYHWADPR